MIAPACGCAVAREYARAPYLLGGARGEAADHAAELEALCALLGDARGPRPGAAWIGYRLDTFAAITAVARGATALVASDASPRPRSRSRGPPGSPP